MISPTFIAWLDSIKLTAPFTLQDAQDLHAMIHKALAPERCCVEVNIVNPALIAVRVDELRREFTVV